MHWRTIERFAQSGEVKRGRGLSLDYNLRFPLVMVTRLSAWWKRWNDHSALVHKHRTARQVLGSVPFDFSAVTERAYF